MKRACGIAVLLLLAGCMSSQEAAQKERQRAAEACAKRGFLPNTQAFDDCRAQEKAAQQKKIDEMQQTQQQQLEQQQQQEDIDRSMPRIPGAHR